MIISTSTLHVWEHNLKFKFTDVPKKRNPCRDSFNFPADTFRIAAAHPTTRKLRAVYRRMADIKLNACVLPQISLRHVIAQKLSRACDGRRIVIEHEETFCVHLFYLPLSVWHGNLKLKLSNYINKSETIPAGEISHSWPFTLLRSVFCSEDEWCDNFYQLDVAFENDNRRNTIWPMTRVRCMTFRSSLKFNTRLPFTSGELFLDSRSLGNRNWCHWTFLLAWRRNVATLFRPKDP